MRQLIIAFSLLVACVTIGHPAAQAPTATALLDRYAHGEFDAVANELADIKDFSDILKELQHGGQGWIDAGGPAQRERRELVAATFAMEAARAGEWENWKLVQHINLNPPFGSPNMGASTIAHQRESYQPEDPIFWRPPALLLEWGCALFRKDEAPRPIERWWQLAALGVAERAEDFEFLVGSPFEARGNPKDEMEHLKHVAARFPNERRFALAQGIALEWRSWPEHPKGSARRGSGVTEAQQVFESLQSDDVVGAEATMRLGVLRYREGATDEALKLFDKVEDVTRDRYVIYLARYFRGEALERKSLLPDAERAYRSAFDTIPGAQSATMALSHLLFTRGAHQDAAAIVNASLAMRPQPADPWRGWADADDRFWPELITRLRAEIKK
jgi:tetratricopeptide (TPR) repeat protein